MPRFQLRSAVYLILLSDSDVLLSRRYNTGWQDGQYSLVAGHLDGNETVTSAALREAKEEIGIDILPADIKIVHTMHRIAKPGLEYIDFFAVAQKWDGVPAILEPDKCDDLNWFPVYQLPNNVLAYVKLAISHHLRGQTFSEYGCLGESKE